MKKPKERIEHLRVEIIKHDELYEQNMPIISDTEYDNLYMELVDLEDANLDLFDPDSPTQKIYTKKVEGLIEVKHASLMLSQKKIKTKMEIIEFIEKMNDDIIVEEKLDGLTVVLTYNNNVLESAVSRGTGEIGEVITHSVLNVKNVPKRISFSKKMVVRTEIIIPYAEFERINITGEYANPRNLASGSVRAFDASIAKGRNLQSIAFDLVSAEGIDFKTDKDKLLFLAEQGFTVVPYVIFENTSENRTKLIDYCLSYNEIIRPTLEYMIDGLVIKANSIAKRDALGNTNKHPKWSRAYKFESLEATTVLTNVVFQVGKSGQITPVAEFESVNIGGSNIIRATLHNFNYIFTRDIMLGDRIVVIKANDVIPKVVQSIKNVRTGNELKIETPLKCPACNSLVEMDGANLYCMGINCQPQFEGKFKHYVSRDAMDIDGIGKETIKTLLDEKIIRNLTDIYKLDNFKDEISSLEGFGDKKYQKMVNGAEASKCNSLSKLLYGLSIHQIGVSSAKALAKKFGSMKAILEASKNVESFRNKLLEINDIGDVASQSVVAFFTDVDNIVIIEELLSLGLTMTEETVLVKTDSSIIDKTFVITGKLSKSRDEFKADIELLGGKVSGSVSKKTDYLLMGDGEEGSSKHKTAIELGTKIINESEFINLINS